MGELLRLFHSSMAQVFLILRENCLRWPAFLPRQRGRIGISSSAILGHQKPYEARSSLAQTRDTLDRSCRVAVTGLQALPPVAQARPFGWKRVWQWPFSISVAIRSGPLAAFQAPMRRSWSDRTGVVPATFSGVAEGSEGGCNSELRFCGMSGKSGGRAGGLMGGGSDWGLSSSGLGMALVPRRCEANRP